MTATARVVKSRKVWVGGFDLSGDENECTLSMDYDKKEATVWSDGDYHTFKPGMPNVTFEHKGFSAFGANLVDEAMFGMMGDVDIPISIGQSGDTAGLYAYFFGGAGCSYQNNLKVGELPNFTVSMPPNSTPVRRGRILFGGSSLLAAGEHLSTAFNLGAVLATQKVYAIAHVIDPEGTTHTVDVIIQSDALEAFGSPTDQITFTQFTDRGAAMKDAAGAITDAWWRAKITVGGTGTPKAKVVVIVAIE